MSSLSRRGFVSASSATGVALGMQAPRPADMQDAKGPSERRLLAGRTSVEKLQAALVAREQWTPYPTAADRSAWESLAPAARAELIGEGEEALRGKWTTLEATVLLEYVRNGNRTNFESAQRSRRTRLRALALAECVEGKGRFADEIANGIWITCEETWWGYPAHLSLQKRGSGLPDVNEPVIDLFAAEAGALLAWVDYLLAPQLDRVHKMVRERLAFEMERRILSPYETRNDFWWLGLEADRPMNNWNPWINSNCLACALLMERDQARRARFAHKALRSVDRFLDAYHEDGGCDEGPSYFGHAGGSLFDNLELLHLASNGRVDFYDVPLVKAIGQYIAKVHVANDWYVNFADASARVHIDGDLVYRYGKRIGDSNMQLLGADAAQKRPVKGASLGRQLPALFNAANIAKAPARQPLLRDAWLPGIQVVTARVKEGSAQGLYLAAQGGHNAESHNHNDVGNFIVFSNGEPAIIDAGVELYTAKTFSAKRYEIWTMQSAYHNCPTVNGVMQGAGRSFQARNVVCNTADDQTRFSLDIAGAYPAEAGIDSWHRTLRLDRVKNLVELRDAYVLKREGGRVEWTLMTAGEVKQSAPGELTLSGAPLTTPVKIRYPETLAFSVEDVSTEDGRLKAVWGPRIRRILLKATGLPAIGELVVRIAQA